MDIDEQQANHRLTNQPNYIDTYSWYRTHIVYIDMEQTLLLLLLLLLPHFPIKSGIGKSGNFPQSPRSTVQLVS